MFRLSTNLRRFSTSTSTNDLFKRAVAAIQIPSDSPIKRKTVDDKDKLSLYALFKQAEEGSVKGDRPSMLDFINRAKYDAWAKLGDMSKEEAQKSYIKFVSDIFYGELPEFKTDNIKQEKKEEVAETKPESAYRVKSLSEIVFPRKIDNEVPKFQFFETKINDNGVSEITINRPNKGNAFNMDMWQELIFATHAVSNNAKTKAIIVRGNGKHFSTGMEVSVFLQLQEVLSKETCEGRKREGIVRAIQILQESCSAFEKAPVPVIAAVHGNCIGGAIDLICSADIRYCTKSSIFSIKEADLAIVADLGTLQRLPKLIGHQQAAELAYTCRNFTGEEAEKLGFVLKAFDTEEEMMAHVNKTAESIAKKSPLTIRGVKHNLLYSRDNTVENALGHIQYTNASSLISNDLVTAAISLMEKKEPVYKDF